MSNETSGQKVLLPLDTVNKVMQFMATRPYAEVAELISELQQNAEVVESEAEKEPALKSVKND